MKTFKCVHTQSQQQNLSWTKLTKSTATLYSSSVLPTSCTDNNKCIKHHQCSTYIPELLKNELQIQGNVENPPSNGEPCVKILYTFVTLSSSADDTQHMVHWSNVLKLHRNSNSQADSEAAKKTSTVIVFYRILRHTHHLVHHGSLNVS